MRNLLPLILIVLSCAIQAQTLHQIGSGTQSSSTTVAGPFNNNSASSHMQILYTASEMNAAGLSIGNFDQLGFFLVSSPNNPLPNYTVKYKFTTTNTLVSGQSNSGFTTVYTNSSYNPSGTGWKMLTLSQPIVWNGTNNLIIDVCWDRSANTSASGTHREFATSINQFISTSSNAFDMCLNLPTTSTSTKPQIQIRQGVSCPDPSSISLSSLTSSTANITWNGNGTAQSFLYAFGTTGFNLANANLVTTFNTSVNLTALTSNTSYDFYVQKVCNNSDSSNWVGPFTFSTPCVTITSFPFTEGFETNSSTRGCWSQIQEVGSGNWTFQGGSSGGSISSAYSGSLNARFVSQSGTSSPITKLVSPILNLSSLSSAQLKFQYGQEVWFGDQNELTVYYRTSPTAAWVQLFTDNNNVSSWTEKVLVLPNLSSTYQIAFEGINNWGRANVIDEVVVEQPPTCLAPDSLNAQVGQNSTNLSWNSNGPGNTFQVMYDTAGFNIQSSGNSQFVATTSLSLSSLANQTTYEFYVREICSAGDSSSWSGPFAFTTPCGLIIAPFSESFENNGQLSNCWTQLTTDDFDWTVNSFSTSSSGTGPSAASDGTYYIYTEATSNFNNTAILLSPTIDISPLANPQLVFYYHMLGADMGVLDISIDSVNGNNWQSIWSKSGDQGSNWLSDSISLAAYAGKQIQLRIEGTTGIDFESDMALDNIRVNNGASCPAVASFQVDSLSANSVSLSWVPGGGNQSLVSYGIGIQNPLAGSLVSTTASSTNLTWLSSQTTYTFYVAQVCSPGDTSAWAGPITVSTPCNLPLSQLPIVEGFESFSGTYTANTQLSCNLSFETSNPNGVLKFDTLPSFAGNVSPVMYKNASTGTDPTNFLILTYNLSNLDTSTDEIELGFSFYDAGDENDADDKVWIRGSNISPWIQVYDWQGFAENTWNTVNPNEIDVDSFLTANGQNFSASFQLRFGQNDDFPYSSDGLGLDQVIIQRAPTCFAPTNVSLDSLVGFNAYLSWNSTGTPLSWQLEYDTAGFSLGTGTQVTISSLKILPSLAPQTTYDIYVRQICTVGDTSAWTVFPLQITTPCLSSTVSLPFVEDFETYAGSFQDNQFFTCNFSFETSASSGTINFDIAGGNSSAKSAALYKNGSGTDPENALLFEFDFSSLNTATDDIELGFSYLDNADENSPFDKVWIRGSNTSSWIEVYDLLPASNTNNQWITILPAQIAIDDSLSAYNQQFSSTFQVRFGQLDNVSWTGGDGIAFDDIILQRAPTCFVPDSINVDSVSLSEASISWANNGASLWQIAYSLQGGGVSNATVLNTSSPFINLNNLQVATAYEFYIRSICTVGDTSMWSPSIVFQTNCGPLSTPYSESFEQAGNIPICWTQETTDDFDWTINAGGTQSSATGPSAASNGSYYLYTEASSNFNNTSVLNSPVIDLSSLTYPQLKFNYHMYGSDMGTFSILIDTVNGSNYDTLWTLSGDQGNSWKSDSILLLPYLNQQIQLKFVGTTGSSFNSDIAFDNLSIDNQIGCLSVASHTVDSITTSSAFVSWPGGFATGYLFDFGLNNNQPNVSSAIYLTNAEIGLSALLSDTTFQFYIASICANGDTSNWYGPHSFRTLCNQPALTLPFTVDFELNPDTFSGSYQYIDCGIELNASNQNATIAIDSVQRFNGISAARLFKSTSAGADPEIYLDLTFNLSNYNASFNQVELGFSFFDVGDENNAEDRVWIRGSSTNQWVEVFDWTGFPENIWHTIAPSEINVDSILLANGQNFSSSFQVRFGQKDDFNWPSDGLAIDDVILQEGPSCPSPSALQHEILSADSLALNWFSNAPAQQYEFSFDTSAAPFTGNEQSFVVSATNNAFKWGAYPYHQNLATRIRAICGAGDTSQWSSTYYLNTLAGSVCQHPEIIATLPYSAQNQTTSGFGDDYSSADACGSSYLNGDDFVFSYTPSIDQSVGISLSNTSSWTGIFVTENCPDSGNCTASNTQINGNPQIDSVFLQAGVTYFILVSTNPAPQSTSFDINITDVSCPPPALFSLDSSTVSTAQISWASSANSTKIEFGLQGYALGQGTQFTSSTKSFAFQNLSSNTYYDVYLQNECSAQSKSQWVGPFTFKTNCSVLTIPYFNSFESNTDLDCFQQLATDNFDWSRISGNTPSPNTGPSGASAGLYYLFTEASQLNNPSKTAILRSPSFLTAGFSNLQFSFDYNMNGSSMGSLYVLVRNGNGVLLDTIFEESGNLGSAWRSDTIDLSNYSSNVLQFDFVGVTGSSQNSDMAIDNLALINTFSSLAEDVALNGLLFQDSICGSSQTLRAIVCNNGNNALSNVPISIYTNGQRTDTNLAYLGIGCDTVDVLQVNTSAGGIYSFSAKTTLAVDTNVSNDSAALLNQIIYSQPLVQVADTVFCENSGLQPLPAGNFTGGVYLGSGIIGNTINTNSSISGSYQYVYTSSNGCADTASFSVSLSPRPTVNLGQNDTVCTNSIVSLSVPLNLSAVWNDGSTLTSKTLQLTSDSLIWVEVSNTFGCTQRDSIRYFTFQEPTLADWDTSICKESQAFQLNVYPQFAGNYAGTAITNNRFDPALASVGINTATFNYSYGNNCMASKNIEITINPMPVVSINLIDSVCQFSQITLSAGMPAGGVYTGSQVNNGILTASQTGIDSVFYTYTDTNNCETTIATTIFVWQPTSASLLLGDSLCLNSNAFVLNQGLPAGGSYFGDNVQNGLFISANVGINTIFYLYVDENNCSDTSSSFIYVRPEPEVNLGNDTSLTPGNSILLNAGSWITYQWQDNSTAETFLVDYAQVPGSFSVVVTDAFNCAGSDTIFIDKALGISAGDINSVPKIYPNPFERGFWIDNKSNSKPISLQLFNAQGKLILEEQMVNEQSFFDLSEQPNGVYFVRLASIDSSKTFRIIKK